MIFSNKASVNFYMFHGGTNWGFMNGANVMDTIPFYAPDVSSYGMKYIIILFQRKKEIGQILPSSTDLLLINT